MNTIRFIQQALFKEIDLKNTYILHIENKGGDSWGMVAALNAREGGAPIPNPLPNSPEYLPGELNWYYHAIVIADGFVFDYDFGNTPRVLPLEEYLEEMFIPNIKRNDSVFWNKKLGYYFLQIYSIKDEVPSNVLNSSSKEILEMPVEMSLKDFLKR